MHSIETESIGGIYDNGRRLSQLLRERVLDLHHDGMNPQLIADEVKSSRHFVRNVLRDYDLNNSSMPKMRETQPRSKLGRDVVEYLENEKLCKPSVTSAELQQRLLLDGIVHPVDLPSKSAISKCMREELVMTKKKIQQVPYIGRKKANKYSTTSIGKVDDHYRICPPIDSVSIECNGQRPLWENHEILFNNLAKPFETLKSRKMF